MTLKDTTTVKDPMTLKDPMRAKEIGTMGHVEDAHRPDWCDRTFIVIAAYNEGNKIAEVVRGLRRRFANVVVVDDGSRDHTFAAARSAGALVMRHVINRGQGAALQTGIALALQRGADFVVTFDADGQHRENEIDRLMEPLLAGRADIALGSRFLDADAAKAVPRLRRLVLMAAILFTWITSGVRLTDAHNGFRAFSRRAAARLDIRLDRMAHASEIIDQVRQMRLPYVEVPVHIDYTEYSMHKGQASSAAFRVAFDYLVGKFLR